MSVRWITLWVRPPPVKICVSVRWVTLWVRPPLYENMCVRSLGYIIGASPLRWILAYCLLRFASFYMCSSKFLDLKKVEFYEKLLYLDKIMKHDNGNVVQIAKAFYFMESQSKNPLSPIFIKKNQH